MTPNRTLSKLLTKARRELNFVNAAWMVAYVNDRHTEARKCDDRINWLYGNIAGLEAAANLMKGKK